MNALDLFKREILRPLVTLAVPGALAITPYIILFWIIIPRSRTIFDNHEAAMILLLLALAIALGLVLEDMGSRIEDILFDGIDNGIDVWDRYLFKTVDTDNSKNGEKYLSAIVLRMKFEFGTIASLLYFFIPGLFLMFNITSKLGYLPTSRPWNIAIICLSILLALYLYIEGVLSIITLHNTRAIIIKDFFTIASKLDVSDNLELFKETFKIIGKNIYFLLGEIFISALLCLIFGVLSFKNHIFIDYPQAHLTYNSGEIINLQVHATDDIKNIAMLIDDKYEHKLLNKKGKIFISNFSINNPGRRRISLAGYSTDETNKIIDRSMIIKVQSKDK